MRLSLLLMTIILLLLTLTGFMGAAYWLLDLTSHFRIQYTILASVLFQACLINLLVNRSDVVRDPLSITTSGLAAFALLINVVVLWPFLGEFVSAEKNNSQQEKQRVDFKVLQLNLWQSNERCEETIAYVLKTDADFVAHEELDSNCFPYTGSDSFQKKYPYQVHAPESRILLASKHELTSRIEFAPSGNKSIIVAETSVDGEKLTLIVTHPDRPNRNEAVFQEQVGHMKMLAKLSNNVKGNLVVTGDLNTTPFSHVYRVLMSESSLKDSMKVFGLQASYPARFPKKWIETKPDFPFALIPIDHFLYQGRVMPVSRSREDRVGSDHYPVLAEFAFIKDNKQVVNPEKN